ncbi:MAG: DUF393 domain-containing protein [Bacteroidia bacterium]|nr:DUF393 domain-containing protein [Bacteroidia bacterium]HQU99880.1 DCC1-like thiol-disulfide oxidoreductase family protein [Bacteroidia bacterium]
MIVIYDGNCMFCSRLVFWLIRNNKDEMMRFAAAQSTTAIKYATEMGFVNQLGKSILVVLGNKYYTQAEAIFVTATKLKLPFSIIGFLKILPTTFTNWCYRLIARNRHHLAKHKCNFNS